MRICLISTGRRRYTMQRVRFLRLPPLALETLAALTPREHEVTIADEMAGQPVEDLDADLVGITVMTATSPRAYEVADHYRARGIPVVLGGHHVSLMPDEALAHADGVCIGEADDIWPTIVEHACRGELKPVYEGGRERFMRAPVLPRRDLVPRRAYVTRNTVETTRGCPNNCEFCSVTHFFGGRYRRKPIDSVIEELVTLPDRGHVWFTSDNFTAHRRYTVALLERMKNLRLKWHCQTSIRIAEDPELLELMQESGCQMVLIGFESLDPEGMASISKAWLDPAAYAEQIRTIHDHGMAIYGTFIFGLDPDGPDVFQRTIDFALDNRIDLPQFSILTPWPNTRLYDRLWREERILHNDWSRYEGSHCVFLPRRMTPEQLQDGYHYAAHVCYSWGAVARRLLARPPHPLLMLGLNLDYGRCDLDVNDHTGKRITSFDPQDYAPGELVAAAPGACDGLPSAAVDAPASATSATGAELADEARVLR